MLAISAIIIIIILFTQIPFSYQFASASIKKNVFTEGHNYHSSTFSSDRTCK